MNQETKFRYRLKNSKTGEIKTLILTIQEIEKGENGELAPYFGNLWAVVARDRWTGMKDCNGREIFEADIVEQNSGQEYATRYVIEWYQKRCGFWMRIEKFNEEPRFELAEFRENLVAIGDIHSNQK